MWCAFTCSVRTERGLFVMLHAVLYVSVKGFVSRRYRNVCNSDVYSVINMYLDHFNFCIV